jgi:hypothetical protein
MVKKILAMIICSIFIASGVNAAEEQAVKDKAKIFNIYTDRQSSDNHYIPSGWMGDYGDIKINDQSADTPHEGKTCLQFSYTAKKTQNQGWAGVYWQNPANNWGTKKGGFDLSGMTKLTFWARGQKGGEILQKVKTGGIKGTYPDTAEVEFGPLELTDSWQQFTVNLVDKDLSYISGGFAWVLTVDQNPDGATFFFYYLKTIIDMSFFCLFLF